MQEGQGHCRTRAVGMGRTIREVMQERHILVDWYLGMWAPRHLGVCRWVIPTRYTSTQEKRSLSCRKTGDSVEGGLWE